MINISVIIKALNEEKNISACIKSVIAALKKVGGNNEIILVDSLSQDKTVKIAKKYPIKIYQLRPNWIKTPAAPLQIGYLYSRGKYIYVLDGDMYLKEASLKNLLPYLKEEKLAGVVGTMEEHPVDNMISKRFQKRYKTVMKTGYMEYLNGGGLYKRSAIKEVGYLANPYIRSFEEAELGYRLRNKGYKLLKINKPTIVHNPYESTSLEILMMKWKRGYFEGSGQVIRNCFKNKYFLKHILVMKIHLITIFWWCLGIISFILFLFTKKIFFYSYIFVSLIILIGLFIKKKSVTNIFHSIFTWSLIGIGLLIGLIKKPRDPDCYPSNPIVIKD